MKSENIRKVNIDSSRSKMTAWDFKTARGLMSDAAQAGCSRDATWRPIESRQPDDADQDSGLTTWSHRGDIMKSDARADECDDREWIYPFCVGSVFPGTPGVILA